jgi:hypothetical protein
MLSENSALPRSLDCLRERQRGHRDSLGVCIVTVSRPQRTAPGPPAAKAAGLERAAATVGNLAILSSGLVVATPAGSASGTPAAAKINTLANVLTARVHCAGASVPACSQLFAYATPPGAAAPATTLAAALTIAHNPANNASAIWGLSNYAGVPFPSPSPLPALGDQCGQPRNALRLNSTDGSPIDAQPFAISTPQALAVDTLGNVWITQAAQANGTELTKLTAGNADAPLRIARLTGPCLPPTT